MQGPGLGRDDEVFTGKGGYAIVLGEADQAIAACRGTGTGTGTAEQAAPHIQGDAVGLSGGAGFGGRELAQGPGGADVEAGAAGAAVPGRDLGASHVAGRKARRLAGEIQRPVFLVQAFLEDVQHVSPPAYRSWPQ